MVYMIGYSQSARARSGTELGLNTNINPNNGMKIKQKQSYIINHSSLPIIHWGSMQKRYNY